MSTRSIVAKPAGDSWEGRYVHFDGYPTGVGQALFNSYHAHFGGDIKAMREALIDAEPVGWSDFGDYNLSLPGQWLAEFPSDEERPNTGPRSYSARGETPRNGEADVRRPEDGGEEWVYVLADGGLMFGREVTCTTIVPWDADPDEARAILEAGGQR